MCSQKDIERIDSGKYVVVLKWEHYIKLWAPIFGFLSLIVAATIWKTNIENRTFSDVVQKQEVLYFVSRGRVMTDIEKASITAHMKDEGVHMNVEERIEMKIVLDRVDTNLSKLLENKSNK